MTEVQLFRAHAVARGIATSVVALLAGACTFDFEAPFAGGGDGGAGGATSAVTTPTTSTSTTTASGEGGESADASVSVTVTSSGASTTSTTSSTTSSQSSGQPLEEDCANGVDDDGDDDVDCQDSTCEAAGYGCELAAPEGFEGPVALVRGPSAVPPSCGGNFPEELIAGGIGELTAAPPTCTACDCQPPVDATCSSTLRWTSDVLCALPLGSMEVTGSGCVDVNDVTVMDGVVVDPPVVVGGDCEEVGGVATVPPFTFEETVKLCGAPLGGGCDEGDVCVRQPESPFDERLCVYKLGDSTCAGAEPFTDLVEVHQDVDDQRGCTDCVCGAPTGLTCTAGSTALHASNNSCGGQAVVVAHDGSCESADSFRSIITDLEISGGSCSASGGAPIGTAFPTGPVTVCCLL